VTDVVIVSDTHFDDNPNYPMKFEEDLAALRGIYRDAVTSRIRCIIHAGDLLERNDRVYASVYVPVYDLIRWGEDNGVPTVIVAGNHDMKVLNNPGFNAISPFGRSIIEGEVFNLEGNRSCVVWGTAILDINDYTEIMCVPYYKDTADIIRTTEAMSVFKPCIMVGHFSAIGFDMRYGVFDRVILGHEHKFQLLNDNVMHLGSLFEHSFADEGSGPGRYLLLSLPDDGLEVVTLEVNNNNISRLFKTIPVNNPDDYDAYVKAVASGDYVNYYTRPSASSFGEDMKAKKLIDKTINTSTDYLITTYTEDNYKGSLSVDGVKAVGRYVVEIGGR